MTSGPAFILSAQTILNLREQRQSLIAANVSNSDTPGYKAMDINFQRAVSEAVNSTHAITKMKPEYVADYPVALDGNDVSPTMEKLESLKNVGAMNAEVTFLHQATTDLITALRPNPSGI